MPKEPSLEADFKLFERTRREWAQTHLGQYVVIREGSVAGFYSDYESALSAGLQKFGVESQFLVKQVSLEEPVFMIY